MTFPGSPRLLKGAIVTVKGRASLGQVIVFQYNPDTLTRTIRARTLGGEVEKGEPLRFKGPPEESIKLDIEIDAADQELTQPLSATMGVTPALAALEALLYPDSARMIANEALLAAGSREIIPPEVPLTLFAWGATRILPVRIASLSVSEEAFDPMLNPIRAKVGVELTVLTYQELGFDSVGGSLFLAHQVAKEVLGRIGSVASLASAVSIF